MRAVNGAAAVVFSHEIDTVIGQAGDGARQGGLAQTSCAIVRQAVARAGFIGTDQLVVEVVGVGPDAVSGQVAFGVMSKGGPCCCRVLVEAVGGVAFGAVGITRPLVAVVGPALPCDFLHLVARVGIGLVLCGAGEVVCEGGQCTLRAVGIAGGGTVTQGHCGTPAEVIVGVGGQVDRAGFLDRGRTVERIERGRDVERGLRPGEPLAVDCIRCVGLVDTLVANAQCRAVVGRDRHPFSEGNARVLVGQARLAQCTARMRGNGFAADDIIECTGRQIGTQVCGQAVGIGGEIVADVALCKKTLVTDLEKTVKRTGATGFLVGFSPGGELPPKYRFHTSYNMRQSPATARLNRWLTVSAIGIMLAVGPVLYLSASWLEAGVRVRIDEGRAAQGNAIYLADHETKQINCTPEHSRIA